MINLFKNMFGDLFLPVIVCKNEPDWPVVYHNPRAGLLLSPTHSVDQLIGRARQENVLESFLRFRSGEEYQSFLRTAKAMGQVDDFRCEIKTYDDKEVVVSLSAITVSVNEENDHFLLFIIPGADETQNQYANQLSSIINTAFLAENVDASIGNLLALSGEITKVSRAYIFEEISPTMTRNTYEWCAAGTEPAIQDLQELAKADYNYDVIVSSGMYITDDVSLLPSPDKEILQMQGIQSLAIIPIYDNGKAIGYVGFDDCEKTRTWSHDEVQYLKSISVLLAMFILRRKAEENINRSSNILQLVSDNSDELVYVNALGSYELLFVNRALARMLGKEPEELIGKKCYEVIHAFAGTDRPCDFCPMPKIQWDEKSDRSAVFAWELQNDPQKTFLAKDNIIKWIDGQYAHVETAIDISARIEYEAKLKVFASTDRMTGIYNREWGGNLFDEKLGQGAGGSLCFVDIDGLKITNDTHGHAAGDELLKETVRTIGSFLEEDEILCRWGGDEFLIWFNKNTAQAKDLVGRIQDEMQRYNENNDKPFKLSFSYGIVPFVKADEAETLDTLVTRADSAMYQNKMSKRGLLHKRRRDDKIF